MTNENLKIAQKKYRETHKEEIREKQKLYTLKYYEGNREKCCEQKRKSYRFKKECSRLANILL